MRGLVLLACLAIALPLRDGEHKGIPTCSGQQGFRLTNKAGWGLGMDPYQLLGSLSALPPQEQKLVLALAGESLKEQLGMSCNIFGGRASCVSIPQGSEIANLCKEYHTKSDKVDCVFSVGLGDSADSVAALEQGLDRFQLRDLKETCPQCLSNLRAMVCAQKLPPCGSFDTVESAMLPALQQVRDAIGRGKSAASAVAAALPAVLDHVALSQPCQEQCRATVDSCSCAEKELTFGELLDQAMAARDQVTPRGWSSAVFSELRGRKLCELFVPQNTTGFTGSCHSLPAKCSNEKKWCAAGSGHTKVEQQLALHLAQTLFGFTGGLTGGAVDRVVSTATRTDLDALKKKYIAENPEADDTHSRHSTAMTVAGSVLGVAAGMVLAAAGFFVHSKWQARRHQTGDGAFGDGYAMMPTDS